MVDDIFSSSFLGLADGGGNGGLGLCTSIGLCSTSGNGSGSGLCASVVCLLLQLQSLEAILGLKSPIKGLLLLFILDLALSFCISFLFLFLNHLFSTSSSFNFSSSLNSLPCCSCSFSASYNKFFFNVSYFIISIYTN